MKSILILTSAYGEGHNAAARNLAAAIRTLAPDARVEVADVFAEVYGKWNRLSVRLYHFVINRLPWLWQHLFDWLHRTTFVPGQIGLFRKAARRLREKLEALKPEVVVSTYPGNNFLLDHLLRRSVRRPFQTVTIVTDSITINSAWIQGHSDFWVTANAATTEIIRALGVPPAKLRTLGFPVPPEFAELGGVRPPGPPWRVLYAINAGRHLAPAIVEKLLEVPGIELTVTVGRDETLAARLREVGQRAGREFPVLGWVSHMPELMATHHVLIGKAGGATVQESLAAGTPMIITQIVPGQEEGNARLVIENGAGCLAQTPEEIARTLARIFAGGANEWSRWSGAARSLGTPRGALETARFVLEQ
ncbi:MAG TPA: glycosyltransferase [Chthoniobacterales bacterium]